MVIESGEHAPVEVRGTQPALVLAYLVLERPRPLLRDELAELLWPADLPSHWEGAARQVVSRVRRSLVAAGLPAGSLNSEGGVTSLDIAQDVSVDVELALHDVEEAERLVEAGEWAGADELVSEVLQVLRPTFLSSADSPYVFEWRDRLSACDSRAMHAGAAAALATEHLDRAIELTNTCLERDPYDEQATRLLMTAHARAGNRPAALIVYERLRRRLDEELGVRPSGETDELYRDMLGDAPATRDSAVASVRRPPPDTAAGPFVGRRHELDVLDRCRQQVGETGCQVVVLEGEPGIGKTRLTLEETERARAAGAAVVWGTCGPEIGGAYGPFADIAGQLVTERHDLVERLGVVAGHLAPLVPELTAVTQVAGPASEEQVTARLFRAVSRLLASASDEPLVVMIDDLHWADADTLALLRHIVLWIRDRPVVVLLATRTPPPAVAETLAELHRLVPTTTLRLTGLSVDDVTDLLSASGLDLAGGAATVGAQVAARTAGNPLYVTQIVREARDASQPFDLEAVPGALSQFLEHRLASLDQELASLLVTAAVAGPVFTLEVIAACVSATSDELVDRLEALCRLHFIDELDVRRFGFAHELMRDAVLETVGATRRSVLHQRVADALAAAGSPSDEIAFHYRAAGPDCAEPACRWSLVAGNEAITRAAWSAAREHFEAAVQDAPAIEERCEGLTGLGRAQRALGLRLEARETLEAAVDLAYAHDLPRPAAAATLALVGGGGRGVALDLADGERADRLRAVLGRLEPEDSDLLVGVLGELALALVLTDQYDERVALCERAVAIARERGEPAQLAMALEARRTALMGPSGTPDRVTDAREVLTLPRAKIPPESALRAQLALVEDLIELGDRAGTDAALAAARKLAEELGHPYWSWATACWTTLVAIIDGRCDEAEQLAFAALEQQADHPEAVAALGVNLVDIRLFQGRVGEMLDLLTTAADENPQIPAYRAVLALCALEAGDVDRGREAYEYFARSEFRLPADSNWLLAVAVLADAAATLDDVDGARRLVDLLGPFADRHVVLNCYGGGGAYWGPVAHHLGRLAAVTGDTEQARVLLDQAVSAAEAFGTSRFAERSRAARAEVS